MTKKKQVLALLIAAAVLFAMLFFVVYIGNESDHHCTEENCPVCYQLGVCHSMLKTFSAVLCMAAVSVLSVIILCGNAVLYSAPLKKNTLFSLKVLLLD